MKRAYLAISLLSVCIFLCIFEQYTVKTVYTKSTDLINQAISYTDNDDYEKAEVTCKTLSQFWDKKYPFLTAMTDHGSLDEAKTTINSLEDMANEKSDDLHSTLVTAKNQIKTIRDNQEISFGNIF